MKTVAQYEVAMDRSRGWKAELASSMLLSIGMRIASVLHPLLRAYRVDIGVSRALLETRLTLDLKGDPRSPKSSGAAIGPVLVVLFFWLAGVAAGIGSVVGIDAYLWMTGAQAMVSTMLAFLLLMQFGSILVDPTDIGVVASRPIDDRTLFASRLAHAFCYLAVLGGAFAMMSTLLACVGFRSPLPLLMVPLCTLLSALLVLGAVGALYTGLLRIAGPAKFQRLVLWGQIGLLGILMGGGQALQFLIPLTEVIAFAKERSLAFRVIPFAQSGGLFELTLGELTRANVVHSIAALALPVVATIVTLWLASRNVIAGMTGDLNVTTAKPASWAVGSYQRLGERLTKGHEERAGYTIGFALAGRDRIFLRAAYPTICALVFPVFAMGIGLRSTTESVSHFLITLAPYAVSLAILTVGEFTRMTETPEARWLLRALPIENPSAYLLGAVKAVAMRTVLPLLVILGTLGVGIAGIGAIPDITLSTIASLTIGVGGLSMMQQYPPFTHKPQPNEIDTRNIGVVLTAMLYAGLAAATQAAIYFFLPRVLMLVVAAALLPVLRHFYRKLDAMEVLPVPE